MHARSHKKRWPGLNRVYGREPFRCKSKWKKRVARASSIVDSYDCRMLSDMGRSPATCVAMAKPIQLYLAKRFHEFMPQSFWGQTEKRGKRVCVHHVRYPVGYLLSFHVMASTCSVYAHYACILQTVRFVHFQKKQRTCIHTHTHISQFRHIIRTACKKQMQTCQRCLQFFR